MVRPQGKKLQTRIDTVQTPPKTEQSKVLSEFIENYAQEAGLQNIIKAFPRRDSPGDAFELNRYLMAPMAGVSDSAWRIMARLGGAALAYTEMVSVAGLHFGSDKTWDLVIPSELEPDIAVQLFGSKPEQFEEAAALVYERLQGKLALIDINMACPVPKVVKKGEGSALLDDPERASAIVAAVKRGCESQVPVTAKIRRGRALGAEVAPDFAQVLEAAGLDAVTVHGRYAAQLYRGKSDAGCIGRVVEACEIPVIASGDITDAKAARDIVAQTDACAVMIARGSYGNPWIFADAQAGSVLSPAEHTLTERFAAFRLHIRLLQATGAHIVRARSLAGWYMHGLPGAAALRARAMECSTADQFISLAEEVEDELSEL